MKSRKPGKLARNAVLFLLMAGFLFWMFHQDFPAILACLDSLSAAELVLLPAMGLGYSLLDAAVFFSLVQGRLPSFRYRESVTLTFLTVFGNTTTSGAGSLPLQSYYLYRRGLSAGSGVGLMLLEYILHKTTVLLYAAAVMLAQGSWLRQKMPSLMRYIYPGFAVCGAIIAALALLCTWDRVRQLLEWGIGKLPKDGPWEKRKEEWNKNLEFLYKEAEKLRKNRRACRRAVLFSIVKLSWLYTIPCVCLQMAGAHGLPAGKAFALSSILLLITGALPNVAGAGPTEFAFLLLFEPWNGRATAAGALILYRIATYFFPFLISIGVFLWQKKNLPLPQNA